MSDADFHMHLLQMSSKGDPRCVGPFTTSPRTIGLPEEIYPDQFLQ